MTSAPIQTPHWVKNAIFYQIFPDRFAKSAKVAEPTNIEPWDTPPTTYGYKGGDLLGIVEHLDYLSDLGITAIYLNPIFQSASNHRYHTHDYYLVDPILGGNKAFTVFLNEAHRNGMRVVLDGVFNHASRGFYQFNHLLELGADPPYVDWWHVTDFPLNAYSGSPNYKSWVNLPALPKFNTANPQVRQYIYDIARYWLDQGIDGWRLDVPFEIDDDAFWQEFRQVVKSANPEAYIVGEVAWEAQRWLQGDQFDAVMNYQFMQACLGFFGAENINRTEENGMMGLPATQVLDAPGFARRLEQLLTIYPTEIALAQLNLLDSHDMPRFLTLAGSQEALKLATLVQMTYPGAPSIYYGSEIGLEGGRHDPDKRRPFPWDPAAWDTDLLAFFTRLTTLRKAHPALRTGEFKTLLAKDGVVAYLRRLKDDDIVVVINNTASSYHLAIPVQGYLPDDSYLTGLLGHNVAARVVNGELTRLAPPPHSGIVLSR